MACPGPSSRRRSVRRIAEAFEVIGIRWQQPRCRHHSKDVWRNRCSDGLRLRPGGWFPNRRRQTRLVNRAYRDTRCLVRVGKRQGPQAKYIASRFSRTYNEQGYRARKIPYALDLTTYFLQSLHRPRCCEARALCRSTASAVIKPAGRCRERFWRSESVELVWRHFPENHRD
jgi:hypothetical protein